METDRVGSGHNSHVVSGLGTPNVYSAQRTGASKMSPAVLPEDHWSGSFMPTELTQDVAI